MRRISINALVLSAVLGLAACGSSVKLDEGAKVEERSPAPTTSTTTSDSRTVAPVSTTTTDPLNDPQGVLARRSVYFDYDSFIVKDEFQPVLAAHGQYLNNNRSRKIVIQGHTDERGGSEYNLALGQKRAEAVVRALSLLGVPEAQMEAVSFGEEKPKATGTDEAAWAENRRADIVYQ
ncbi:MAG TPA: peptidoglycan-associated lipoprotein Pal [Noviherbaspirillum sp.]